MGQRLWKITNSDEFGDYDLIDFLEKHGAVFDSKPVLDVPPKAVMAALRMQRRWDWTKIQLTCSRPTLRMGTGTTWGEVAVHIADGDIEYIEFIIGDGLQN